MCRAVARASENERRAVIESEPASFQRDAHSGRKGQYMAERRFGRKTHERRHVYYPNGLPTYEPPDPAADAARNADIVRKHNATYDMVEGKKKEVLFEQQ